MAAQATQPKDSTHHIIAMQCPPSADERKQLAPFTEQVLALSAKPDVALVYARAPGEKLEIVLSRVRCAVSCAVRRAKKAGEPPKDFAIRKIRHARTETFAVWRLK